MNTKKMNYLGMFSGEQRGYSKAYPETEKVVYRVYISKAGKEYGIPLKSGLTIDELTKNEVTK